MEQKKEYAAVDIFKMICAILVMLIHTKPFENIFWVDAAIGMVTRFAVPFFFTVSGYFLFKKVSQNPEKKWSIVGKYILRLLRFYIIWFIILRIVDITVGGSIVHSFSYYFKHFFFTTDGSPLWFVAALMWAVILYSVLLTVLKSKAIFVIGIIFLMIGYCFSTMLGLTDNWPVVQSLKPFINYIGVQGSLFFAFPYVALGALMTHKGQKTNIKRDILGIVIFFICLGVESLIMVRKFNAPLTFLWLFMMPTTYFTTHLVLTLPIESKPGYYILRKISTLCYVLHVVIFKSLIYIFDQTGITEKDPHHILLTVSTILITLSLAHCIYILSRKKAFSWIKYCM